MPPSSKTTAAAASQPNDMRIRNGAGTAVAWLAGALVVLALSACTLTQNVGRAVPVPDVHVTAELSPGPPGENPTITMVNPTTRSVYARCTIVIFSHHGTAIFRGTVPSGPGLRSPPGRFVWGSGALADDKGHVFDFRGQRYRTSCNAFVWHGQPPA